MIVAPRFVSFRAVLTLALVTVGTSCAASEAQSSFLPLGRQIDAPRGFVAMCQETQDFCSATPVKADNGMVTAALTDKRSVPSAPTSIESETPPVILGAIYATSTVNAARIANNAIVTAVSPNKNVAVAMVDNSMKLLRSVNRYVNGRVRQRTDLEIYGRDEFWVRSGVGRGASGDCEDIAIEKRHELIARGFPPARLSFAVVYSTESGLHTVLIAHNDDGDVVLDSRTPFIRRWSEVSYSWVSVQSMGDPMIWRQLA